MAELAREDVPAAVEPSTRIVRGTGAASAPLELASSDDEAPPPKRARTRQSADDAALEPEEDARPPPRDDEATPLPPQREEEDATPFSRGVAIAEIEIMRYVEKARARGDTAWADALEATMVTTAAQRQAALVPRPLPENAPYRIKKWRQLMELRARKYRDLGMASAANRCLLEGEEIRECGVRFDQHAQWMKNQRP